MYVLVLKLELGNIFRWNSSQFLIDVARNEIKYKKSKVQVSVKFKKSQTINALGQNEILESITRYEDTLINVNEMASILFLFFPMYDFLICINHARIKSDNI